MNAKRQTIWLVSMLSLMVVLSAYYLFTEDVSKLDLASTDTAGSQQEVKIDMSQTDQSALGTSNAADANASSDTKAAADTKATDGTAAKDDAKALATADASKDANQSAAAADEKILQQVEAQTTSAQDYFTTEKMKWSEELAKKTEKLMLISQDSSQKPEAVAQALNELEKISDQQEKIDSLEETLMKDYKQAIVTQEGNDWKVTVLSDKLEKSQGVTIVDMIINELGAKPENIKIQYVRP